MLLEVIEKWSDKPSLIDPQQIAKCEFMSEYAEVTLANGIKLNVDTVKQDFRLQLIQLGVMSPALIKAVEVKT